MNNNSETVKSIYDLELLEVVDALATLTEQGLPILWGLKTIINSDNFAYSTELKEIAGDIEKGNTLSEALGKHKHVFDDIFIGLCKAGELGGVLEIIMRRWVTWADKVNSTSWKNNITQQVYTKWWFFSCFSTLTASGVPILRTLKLLQNSFDNVGAENWEGLCDLFYQRAVEGESLVQEDSERLNVLSPIERVTIQVGEECGTLPQVLGELAAYQERKYNRYVRSITL